MANSNILIVNDDKTLRDLLADILQFEGYSVVSVGDGESALKVLESHEVDLVLLDLVLPNKDGIEILKSSLTMKPSLSVVMISGQGTIQRAVEATRIGAYDFLEKPLEAQRVLVTVRNALEANIYKKQTQLSVNESIARYGMIGKSSALQSIFSIINILGPTNTSVLISGESGTGKELVAQALHKHSKRAAAPFMRVNCAAIPDTLIESELFGHQKGAFTDARSSKKGLLQLAHSGTLFLDEIGDLSLPAQAKVLLAVERGEFLPVGSEKYQKVDVRLISASNKNIEEMTKDGTFREDLFYRINAVPLHLSPLRERLEDINPLAQHFLNEACHSNDLAAKELLPDAQFVLKQQPWKGNVRELKHFVEKLAILTEPTRITGRMVQNVLKFPDVDLTPASKETLGQAREAFERSYILTTLQELNWNISQSAEALGIERSHLYRKMEKLGIKEE